MDPTQPLTKPTEIPSVSTSFLGKVQRMDPASWSRLVMTFAPIVYRWCRRSGISQDDAPDVVQDVFATVARSISSFERQRQEGSFRAWLATITRSRVRDFLRREQRHQPASGGTDALAQLNDLPADIEASISVESMESPLARRVMQILQTEFEEVTWKAFYMTTIESLSPAMTAQRLQISLASVYQARTRVLRKLRQRLSEL